MVTIPYGIYIHVPFCRQACSYCDFYFITRQELIPSYTEALLQDIRTSATAFRNGLQANATGVTQTDSALTSTMQVPGIPTMGATYQLRNPSEPQLQVPGNRSQGATDNANTHAQPRLKSVYFGGGTPSRLPASEIEKILQTIHEHHGLDNVQEITMEANPDDLTSLQVVRDLKNAGITRLSMGIQSFNPRLLTFMNRAHTARQAEQSLDFIQQAGFKTHTVDLIYGNPGQTLQELETDIKTFLSWSPPHISAYALTIELGTRLGKALQLGRLSEPDDHEVARHMELTVNMLSDAGLQRYEVSNFARAGHEALHNSSYWNHTSYLGIGPGAHGLQLRSTPEGRLTGALRWSNPADVRAYIQLHQNKSSQSQGFAFGAEIENLSPAQLAEERLLMGLRTSEGVHTHELHTRYGYQLSEKQLLFLEKMRSEGYFHPRAEALENTSAVEQQPAKAPDKNSATEHKPTEAPDKISAAEQQPAEALSKTFASQQKPADTERKPSATKFNPSQTDHIAETSQRIRLTDAGMALADRLTLELLS